jgi:hypothetical protein
MLYMLHLASESSRFCVYAFKRNTLHAESLQERRIVMHAVCMNM